MSFSIKGAVTALFMSLFFISSANAQFILRSHKTAPSMLPTFTVNSPSNYAGYFEVNTGANWAHEIKGAGGSLDGGLGLPLGLTLGLENNLGLAAEVEYTYRNSNVDFAGVDFNLQTHSIMGNLLYYARTPDLTMEPYFGGGAGWKHGELNVLGASLKGDEFAWQVFGGVRQKLNRNTALTLEYRYQDTVDFDLTNGGLTVNVDGLADSSVMLGYQMRY